MRVRKRGQSRLDRKAPEERLLNGRPVVLVDGSTETMADAEANQRDDHIVQLKARGSDVLFGKKRSRICDFRRSRRLGKDDHVVVWKRPKYDASRYESREEWDSLAEEIGMRELRVTVRRKGYKTRTVIIVTTLPDAEQYSANELAAWFAARWNCELDLRSIKRVLGTHHSRCQSPEMVRKELWMHLLAYHPIRVRMAQAAHRRQTSPRKLSFTAAMNHIQNFAQELRTSCGAERHRMEEQLLKAMAACRVGNRPGRKEPRAVKKRQQKYSYLTQPRNQARKRLAA